MTNQTLVARAQDKIALYQLIQETGGELNETLENWLKEIDQHLAEKVDGYRWILDELESEGTRLSDEADQLRNAAKSIENVAHRIKERIKCAMRAMGTDELSGTTYRFKLSRSAPSLVVDDSALPESYVLVVTTTKPDRERIKTELDAGKTIPGVTRVEGFSLRSYVNKESRKKNVPASTKETGQIETRGDGSERVG